MKPAASSSAAGVLLLHGLGRTRWSMQSLERRLSAAGFTVCNHGYPSRRFSVAALTEQLRAPIAQLSARQQPVHVVTHSLGGILLRSFLQQHSLPEGSRAVMLAPPNRGSELCDRYRQQLWYQLATGPAGQELGTAGDALPQRLAPVAIDVGVIAGARSSDPWFNHVFAGPHDGKVSVASTRLDEMRDFLVLPVGHTFLMRDPAVHAAVLSFLRSGRFVCQ